MIVTTLDNKHLVTPLSYYYFNIALSLKPLELIIENLIIIISASCLVILSKIVNSFFFF